jgi:hypothetical protein
MRVTGTLAREHANSNPLSYRETGFVHPAALQTKRNQRSKFAENVGVVASVRQGDVEKTFCQSGFEHTQAFQLRRPTTSSICGGRIHRRNDRRVRIVTRSIYEKGKNHAAMVARRDVAGKGPHIV